MYQASPWEVCSPETAGSLTAVGYFFARDLNRELDVPAGLINTSWGGTIEEAWTTAFQSALADEDDPGDIHPGNKQDVGRRLALLALKNDYAKEVVASDL